ncbi:putative disease resistance RPP13-like protein 1 [Cajanus cajan]|uniref:putative disease resistance RPP13-like protein 1 n=1 Tax=Cajanus cajan TaxID=3821 RepID=UPI00098DB3C1|nr:putative disease resistance RPP13-like protein 1 [Cajanus cajan]XP_020204213.1 putative disease resistance RPP13-like protein 1 [Cajanus cajan]XP_020204214.1 putative disease resistance RPP13-like protein 1 [Cajanus cajan]XP_029125312.1 putative disease resistance RPP13-like protein 1 [Cajanus cajan]XP_029125313.1 putative disease resistance RPP13-like protein 1 [Cajanus cajan]
MAAELVGGALLSSFLQVAFDRLASHQVLDYFRGRKLNEKLLKKLKVKLLSISVVIDDAEEKQFSNSYVKAWLDEVKDVVFDAEDLLDEIDYEFSKCKLEAESYTATNKVRNFDTEIVTRMKQVLDDLEYLSSQKSDLGLEEARGVGVGSRLSSKVSQKLPSTSLVVESVIYGRDDEKEVIFNWLTTNTNKGNQLSILSIVGMGGVGKTTLAQHVYNDPRMEEANFGIKAWVCVSNDFDVLTVSKKILEAITKSKDDSGDLEMVHGRLKEKLSGKIFLLVLDDVWNERREKWEVVQTPLIYGAQGSKILVTTRSKKVSSMMQSNKVHHLKQLQEDHSWQVFAKHALQDDNTQANFELKEIGIKIVKKCKGLPLALKTIGSLLHTKSSISEWINILTSKIWDLPKEYSEIIPALLLSYYHLPSHLKRCFAYCALFPKDYEFDREGLVLLWMAENFLECPRENKSLEDVGEEYFDDLLSRSFFQQSHPYKTYFVMHDLLNDLAKYVCGDICFRLGVDKAKSIPRSTRHVSFVMKNFHGLENLYEAKRLRTFMPTIGTTDIFCSGWHCKTLIHELFSRFKFLHILSLSSCSDLTEVPDSVGDLKHLRSLDLSETDIKKLPDSICSLYNLQILKLSRCIYLEELPLNLYKLINLRHLEFSWTKVRKVPMHLGNLKNLHVLSSFYVGKSDESSIQQLRELNLHGRLSIGQIKNIHNPVDALAADLKNKTRLAELKLNWNWNWNQNQTPSDPRKEREILENLQPSKYLKYFSIRNYGGTQFSSWLFDNSLLNVASLSLGNCKYCLCLPPLGLLPFLKCLKITGLDGIVSIDDNFCGSSTSSFTSLKRLNFSKMKEWEEWECKDGAFPCLDHLSIVKCPKLKGNLPKQLLHLKNLDIHDCRQLVASAPVAREICELDLHDCGELQFDYYPTSLKRLTIGGHNMETSLLERVRHIIYDASLELLHIYSCPNMHIPMSCCYDFLIILEIRGGCDSLTIFSLDFFPKLHLLDLRCHNLQAISQEHAHNHLKDLYISGCPLFESFPSEGLFAPCLERFSIKALQNLKSLPKNMHILLPSLDDLQIEDCPKVESFPIGGLPSNLKRIDLSNCYKLIPSLKEALGANTSLKNLSIGKLDVESFPNEGWLPLSLTSLFIYDCPNLKQMDHKGLLQLSSLKGLIIEDCPNLQYLPEDGLPKSISTLEIRMCPLLKQKLEGKNQGKFSHIKNVRFDEW